MTGLRHDTDVDTHVIEDLDWCPACESLDDECENPATWALLVSPTPCGCKPLRTVFRCHPCYQRLLSKPFLMCTVCGELRPVEGALLNAVRIGEPS